MLEIRKPGIESHSRKYATMECCDEPSIPVITYNAIFKVTDSVKTRALHLPEPRTSHSVLSELQLTKAVKTDASVGRLRSDATERWFLVCGAIVCRVQISLCLHARRVQEAVFCKNWL